MQLRNRIFAAILIPAAVLSIALPAVTLFTGDGFLAPYIRTLKLLKCWRRLPSFFCSQEGFSS